MLRSFFHYRRLFWLLAWLPIAVQAQQASLTGSVVDAASGKVVPFAIVEIPTRHIGVQATEQGTFVLALPSEPLTPADSLQVTSLGYYAQPFAVPVASPCQLPLRASAVALPEAVVRPSSNEPVMLGATGTSPSLRFRSSGEAAQRGGHQIARFFPATSPAYLQSVGFYMNNSLVATLGPCNSKLLNSAPFRVRIYAADGQNGAPGTDLLTSTLLAAAPRKTGWFTVDLRARNIRLPETGFYVAMEWVYTDAQYLCEFQVTNSSTKAKSSLIWYGQTLEAATEKKSLNWLYDVGGGWHKYPVFRPGHGPENPMIQAAVLPD